MFFSKKVQRYLVGSATIAAVCTPVSAGLETLVAGMSNETSWNARLITLGFIVAGGGVRYTNGLRRSREQTVGAEATNGDLLRHDARHCAQFNAITSPFFYFACGSRSVFEIAVGTSVATVLGYIAGGRLGYLLDTTHDLAGIQPTERIHPWLNDKSPRAKKAIVALSLVGSAAATALFYYVNK
ncbi:MAG TPA: hypothetical protein VJH37_04385 [Candidatus Nanoarchaeia archaeon]|nr:hypothetical protein [Candidatus Nanoarchaeia archaeon]